MRTSFTEGDDQQYAVPLLHVSDERAFEVDQQKPGALLALIDDGALVDAMAVPEGAGVVADRRPAPAHPRGAAARSPSATRGGPGSPS